MTDSVKQTVKTTREGIHREVVDIATKLHEIYEAEKNFNKHMDELVVEHYGTEEQKVQQAAKPVKKSIAFGKIKIHKWGDQRERNQLLTVKHFWKTDIDIL